MDKIVYQQLATDYCCTIEEIMDQKNHFQIYRPQKNRRKFQENEECFLKIISINHKLVFAGKKEIIDWCRQQYEKTNGAWFMDPASMRGLNQKLNEFGYQIAQAHPFFTPTETQPVETQPVEIQQTQSIEIGAAQQDYEIRYYNKEEIEQFRGDNRFDEAFAFCEDAPDEIGVAAILDGKILGMAGASSDSPYLWQIGINVVPEARGQNIAAILVTRLKEKIVELGKMPFYGTAMANISSQRVAIKSGFMPAWAELSTERIKGE